MTMTTLETKYLDEVLAKHTQDMTGRVVAITGTTSGTGYVCARELAKLGATLLLLNRASVREEQALAGLKREVPDGDFVPFPCNLQAFESVRSAAAAIRRRFDRLDVLCNNAGVMALPDVATADGYDVQMQTNMLSPFLLTKELFPLLRNSQEARVVSHSSGARLGSDHDPKYFGRNGGNLGGNGEPEEIANFSGPRWERYHQSKLANCTFSYGLKQRLEAAGIQNVKVLLAHPGVARTSLQVTSAEFGGVNASHPIMSQAQTAEDGALGIIRSCADPSANSGDFYGPEAMTGIAVKLTPESLLLDPQNIALCWEGCESAVGEFRL